MTHAKNLKIIGFVGLIGSGKTTAVDYLTEKDIPKVRGGDTNEFIDQINRLVEAGQHRIVTDSNYSWKVYKTLKHEFPGELYVVALLAPRHIRHHRLQNRGEKSLTETEANQRDWQEIEDAGYGGAIALADYYVVNDGDLDNLRKQIDKVLDDIEFLN